jgi:transposase
MLVPGPNIKIYICTGYTDMRKGMNGLTILAQGLLPKAYTSGAMFIFRGKNATKIKILAWDNNGFCLFY